MSLATIRPAFVAAMLLATPASADEGQIALRVPAAVAPDVAAMPLIAHPTTAAQIRVNAALATLDGTIRKARTECVGNAGHDRSWTRSIEVPMRGPWFLSVVVTDDLYCGGAHPDTATMAIVYDLRSGRPVDWRALLPAGLAGTLTLATGADGTRTVQLASPRLRALFLTYYDHGTADDADDCKSAVKQLGDGGPFPVSAWLDAKQGGLVLQTDLPHAMEACADPVLVPAAILKTEGAAPDLLDALAVQTRSSAGGP